MSSICPKHKPPTPPPYRPKHKYSLTPTIPSKTQTLPHPHHTFQNTIPPSHPLQPSKTQSLSQPSKTQALPHLLKPSKTQSLPHLPFNHPKLNPSLNHPKLNLSLNHPKHKPSLTSPSIPSPSDTLQLSRDP
ncbi:hypothetical protein Pcinc_038210 [Petrolisthes cinctipes]|uniref:Uncharacterized protein n=1 Tax=Petrolisthes cinctipes TaxID=88211 RepID=A0AAE1BR16_PETCI|nr:hypothetical protein Pcinc_038210 [Petrolisthes cinctipes]